MRTSLALLPLRHLSMLLKPPEKWLMIGLKAYLDDSGGQDLHSVCVAGYVGEVAAWEDFEVDWGNALSKHGIEYFHMSKVCDPSSPMYKFHGKENAPALRALLIDLVGAIQRASRHRLIGIGGLTPTADLQRFNRERGRNLDATALGLFVALALLKQRYRDSTIEVLFDRVTKAEKKIALAKAYLATSPKGFVGEDDCLPVIRTPPAWAALTG